MKLKFILLALLICLVPKIAFADNTEVQASVTVINNQISDLLVSNPNYTTLTLTWTSPQSSPPNWGPATQYDIRYSLSSITTEAEWQAATQLANPPVPQPPGTPETLLVIGLNPCTTYYFAIKTADTTGTWTSLSNSPQGTTLCGGGGGGGGGGGNIGLPGSLSACPMTLAADMQGNITTASMTNEGVLCEACLAKDASGKNSLELDKGTKLMLAGNVVPALLTVRTASVTLPSAENTVIISPVYEFDAYASAQDTTPAPIVITPSARLILNYDPAQLPENTTEVYIANYDQTEGWLALAPVPGAVAEIGKAHCLLSHFSLYAVLAKVEEPVPAKFEVSNLTISPSQIQLNQEITISVKVTNTGGKSADYTLELKIDNVIKSTKQVTIPAGNSQLVNFTASGDTAGKHQVEIAGLSGEFEVMAAAEPHTVNWWLVGSILGIIAVLAIWSIVGWRWYAGRQKTTIDPGEHTSNPDNKNEP
jgi:hypothetical protein